MAGHLIFGCSSRGAKLEQFLEQRIPIDDWFYHIIVKPGGTIKQIQNEINNSMDSPDVRFPNSIVKFTYFLIC
jgi:hypothetical protein